MIGRINRLTGVLLVALVSGSMSVVSASAEVSYHAESATVSLSGSQIGTNEYTVPGAGTVICSTANVVGTQVGTGGSSDYKTATVSLTQSLSGCKAFGFATVHHSNTHCKYDFSTPTQAGVGVWHAPTDLKCTGSPGHIVITPTLFSTSICTLTIAGQDNVGFTKFENEGSGTTRDIKLKWQTTNLNHTNGCGAEGEDNITISGEMTVKGSEGATQKGIWVG